MAGTLSAIVVFILCKAGVIDLPGQGVPFVAASAAFVVDIIVSVAVTMVTTPKPAAELAGLVYSETPKDSSTTPRAREGLVPQAGSARIGGLALTIILNIVFH